MPRWQWMSTWDNQEQVGKVVIQKANSNDKGVSHSKNTKIYVDHF